jgi:hypothetical protein
VRNPKYRSHTSLMCGGVCRGCRRRESRSCVHLYVPGQVLAMPYQDVCRWDTTGPPLDRVLLDISADLAEAAVL